LLLLLLLLLLLSVVLVLLVRPMAVSKMPMLLRARRAKGTRSGHRGW